MKAQDNRSARLRRQPFFDATHRRLGDGTVSATQGQAVPREIQNGRVDTQTLASTAPKSGPG